MNELRLPAFTVVIASVITLIFVWNPGPFAMGAFTFIAQPLFLIGMVSYAVAVFRDLKNKGVL